MEPTQKSQEHFTMQQITRNTILVVLILTLIMNAKAQNYIPLVKDGNRWHLLSEGVYYGFIGVADNSIHSMSTECSSSYGEYKKTSISKLAGDSVIGQVIYKKIFTTYDSLANVWQFEGLIREDTIKQIVYYKKNYYDEKILYSFNVKVKDTVGIMVVQYVDTILIDNKPHKRIGITWERTWIEGIGGLSGLLSSSFDMPMCSPRLTLLCMYNNNSLLYTSENAKFTKCFYWEINTGMNTLNRSVKFTIYPNPSNDQITIKTGMEGSMNVKIKDIQGRIIRSQAPYPRDTQIDLTDIKAGIYLVEISNETNCSVTKLIKNE